MTRRTPSNPFAERTHRTLLVAMNYRKIDRPSAPEAAQERLNVSGARNDADAVRLFLAEIASPQSQRVYALEIRRLFWWGWREREPRMLALSDLTLLDLQAYRDFLRRPPQRACGPKVPFWLSDDSVNAAWRPFEKSERSARTVELSLSVLKSFFGKLTATGYLRGNPVAGLNIQLRGYMGDTSTRPPPPPSARILDEIQWSAVLAAADALPAGTDLEKAQRARMRWILRAFYHLGARVGELATHGFRHVQRVKGRWVWQVKGKGGKYAEVAVNHVLLAAMREYRSFLGLPELPRENEKTPLVVELPPELRPLKRRSKHGNGLQSVSSRQIFRLVNELFTFAAQRLDPIDPDRSERLRKASPHWIRHAVCSHLVRHVKSIEQLIALQQFMRHDKLETTLGYTHLSEVRTREIAEHLATLEVSFRDPFR